MSGCRLPSWGKGIAEARKARVRRFWAVFTGLCAKTLKNWNIARRDSANPAGLGVLRGATERILQDLEYRAARQSESCRIWSIARRDSANPAGFGVSRGATEQILQDLEYCAARQSNSCRICGIARRGVNAAAGTMVTRPAEAGTPAGFGSRLKPELQQGTRQGWSSAFRRLRGNAPPAAVPCGAFGGRALPGRFRCCVVLVFIAA